MTAQEKISVIVPVYKVERFLSKCVASICGQTYPNLEILLIDDGSPDNCGAMCDAYAREDSRIHVIHKENGGLSSARNAGIEAATGSYLAFVDSDDWIAPDYCETLLMAALENHVKLVCCGRYDVEEATGVQTVGLCPPRQEIVSGQELVSRIFQWDGMDSAAWDKLYHKSLFQEIRYPVGVYYEDIPTTYRLGLLAQSAALIPKPLYYYFHRAGSITGQAISKKTFVLSEHARKIYADICQNAPELSNQAQFLLARSLYSNVLVVEIAPAQVRREFSEQYRQCRKELASNLKALLQNPFFPRQMKTTAVLMVLRLYRPLRKLYHMGRS